MYLLNQLETFFRQVSLLRENRSVVVGFSGGPDSLALLWGLTRIGPDLGIQPHAVHIDHALDEDSSRRADRAEELSRALDVPFTRVRQPVYGDAPLGESMEATARRIRYKALEKKRLDLGAACAATAHHADDQIETVLIRLLNGSGIEGLAGISAIHGALLRPLLGLRRHDLQTALQESRLTPVQDPTNFDLSGMRNCIRHLVLPHLVSQEPDIEQKLLALSRTVTRFRSALDPFFASELDLQASPVGCTADRKRLQELPSLMWTHALARMNREAGIEYPPPTAACLELERQIRSGRRIGVDCGAGWRWQSQGDRLNLLKPPPISPGFAYTVPAPGECVIPELALRFRLRRGAVDTWMFRPSSRRAGLDLPIGPGDCVIVRSRRDGDRVQPFGCSYTRRLKDVLIDRRVPRHERSRLPLLEVDSRLVWIPGVTICDGARVEAGKQAWIAELEPIEDHDY